MKKMKLQSVLLMLIFAAFSCNNAPAPEISKDEPFDSGNPEKTIIVDVRTVEEWNNDGHATCTVNYPLDQLGTKVESLKSFDKVIFVCRSGNRASAAKAMLEQSGFKNVENKGPWQNIDCK